MACVDDRSAQEEASASAIAHGRVGHLGLDGARRANAIDPRVDEEVASGCGSRCELESARDAQGRAWWRESASMIGHDEEASEACDPHQYPCSPEQRDVP